MDDREKDLFNRFKTLPGNQQWGVLSGMAAGDLDQFGRMLDGTYSLMSVMDRLMTRLRRGYIFGYSDCTICEWPSYLEWHQRGQVILINTGCNCVPDRKFESRKEYSPFDLEEKVEKEPKLIERWLTEKGVDFKDGKLISYNGEWEKR